MAANQLWVSANYSEDGTRVVYVSDSNFAYPGGDTNYVTDVYVVDLKDGLYQGDAKTHRFLASVSSSGAQQYSGVSTASFSPDGTKVVFSSTATFGNVNDTGFYGDVFVRDLVAGTTTRVSTNDNGFQFIFANGLYGGSGVENPVFSPDGESVMFNARASIYGFSQVYLKNLDTGKLTIVSSTAPSEFDPDGVKSDYTSNKASFSYDGELVIFESSADNLDEFNQSYGNSDVFIKNLRTGELELISRASGANGEIGNDNSGRGFIDAGTFGGITADNKVALFVSNATNLVSGDTNDAQDVFIRNLETDQTTRVSLTWNGEQANGDTWDAKISPDGTKIVFTSFATNIVKDADTNNGSDVFLKDLETGKVIRLSNVIGRKEGEDSRFGHFSPDGGVVIWQTNVQHSAPDTDDYTEQYYTYVIPGAINGNSKDNTKPGTARPDEINGLGGNDKLLGLGAGDTLNGGDGKDTMTGGQGSDIYIVDDKGDVVDEKPKGSDGNDTVQSSITFSLDSSTVKGKVENLTLTGKKDIDGTGNDLDNILTGNKGDNALKGGGGDDTIKGGAGKDKIDGGAGTDLADYSDKKDAIDVTLKASAGTVKVDGQAEDTLKAIEGIIGGSKNDKITGDTKANILDGGAGKDTLAGGDGKDKFVFSAALIAANVDTIADFKPGTDKIVLSKDIFYEIGDALTADELGVHKKGHEAAGTELIIYDKSKGTLWFDFDGAGAGEAVQIAVLSPKVSTLSVGDFEVA